jgi:DNA repair exonuclease SbcCD ATPase subunit
MVASGDQATPPGAERSKPTSQGNEISKEGEQKNDSAKTGDPNESSPDRPRKESTPRSETPGDRRPSDSTAQEVRKALALAETNQKSIADELQKMLDGLSEFETYRGVIKDAQALVKEQEQTMKQTAESSSKPELMGKSSEELTAEQKADLSNLAARQSQVSRNLRNLLERMDEMAKRLDESDPLAGAALREAAEASRKQATAGKLGEAADRLEKNQMGQAASRQEQARQEMRDLLDSIQNRRERELARLVKELKNAEADLEKLRARQAQNLKKTREALKKPDSQKRKAEIQKLAKEQAEIQKELKRQLQKLAKLNADAAGRAGESAQGRMSKAESQLDQDQGEDAGKEQEDALADLDDAQDELEQTRRDAEEQLANEQLAKMGDHLKSLAERQERVVSDTGGYEKTRQQAGGKLSIAQRSGVRGLGQVQSGLKDETGELIQKLDGVPVFSLTLKRAVENMDDAAKRLLSIKTDAETQASARSAADRFKQLLESLKPDSGKNGGGGGQGGGGGGQGGGGGDGDGIPATAQLKLLKALQEDVNQQTEALEEARRRSQTPNPDLTKKLERLAEEQGTLADIIRDMTRPRRADGED